MKEALRAVGYGRVSTEEQEKSGTSLRDQFGGNQRKAKELGASVVAYFEDVDSGGFYLTRKGLQDTLKTLEEGKANCLIVKDLSRFTRNDRAEQALILKRIKEAGTKLIFWDVTYEDSPLGEFSLNVTGDFAILEKAVIKDRTMRGRKQRAAEGIMPARTIAPFGFIIPKTNDIIRGTYPPDQLGKYLLDEERAPVAAEIFQRLDKGESDHKICRWLQTSGIQTVGGGKFWRPSNIECIVKNTAYYGKAAFGKKRMVTDETRVLRGFKRRSYSVPVPEDQWVYIDCPAIISKELWDRCQQRRKENRERLSTRPTYRLILTGLLRCPKCKRVMSGRSRSRTFVSHYKCKESSPSMTSSGEFCWSRNLNATRIESLVLTSIKFALSQPQVIAAAYQAYEELLNSDFSEMEYQRLKNELSELYRQELNTAKAQIQGIAAGANTTVYETILRDLALQRTTIQTRLDELDKARLAVQANSDRTALVNEAFRDVLTVLDAPSNVLPNSEKNEVLQKVLDHIYPSLEDEGLTITFRSFDDGSRLQIKVSHETTPILSVIDRHHASRV